MDFDHHKIWRLVGNNYRGLEEGAPDGYEPVVEVFLVGRGDPVRLTQVHTTRDPDFPWTLLVSATGDNDALSPEDYVVFAPEEYVQRIEIRLVRSEGRGIGFSHRELEEPTSNDE